MSHFVDYVTEPVNKMDMDIDVDAILPDDMRTIFDHSEFMSSDFFDSVLSMEKDDYDGQSEYLLPPSVKSEDSCTHSPTHDPVLTDHSTDESIKQDGIFDNITLFGKENSETIAGEEFLSLLKENTLQNNINDILGVSNNPSFIIRQAVNANPKKLTNNLPKKPALNNKKPQLLRIQSISGNGKPLLLPVNVNVKNVKKYRVINAADLKVNSIKVVPPSCQRKVEYPASTSSESNDGDIDVGIETSYNDVKYPPLQLTAEEKRLLLKEGISLPSHYPLSKHDEKELKRIRRKIRNKISAQDSRKRKKEYVDQLEEKARRTDEENEILKKRVKILNRENTRLYEQLKKLQDILFSTSNKATPTTCLMIVLFSTLLVCLPNLRPADNKDLEIGDQELVAARRALLFNQKVKDDDDINLEDFLILKKEDNEVHFEEENKENETGAFIKYLGDLSKKYEKIIRSNCTEILQGGSLQEFCKKHEGDFKMAIQNLRSYINTQPKEEKKFIEPDISDDEGEPGGKRSITYLSDDDDPPIKKARLVTDYNENTIPILEVEIKPDKSSLPAKKQ